MDGAHYKHILCVLKSPQIYHNIISQIILQVHMCIYNAHLDAVHDRKKTAGR